MKIKWIPAIQKEGRSFVREFYWGLRCNQVGKEVYSCVVGIQISALRSHISDIRIRSQITKGRNCTNREFQVIKTLVGHPKALTEP